MLEEIEENIHNLQLKKKILKKQIEEIDTEIIKYKEQLKQRKDAARAIISILNENTEDL